MLGIHYVLMNVASLAKLDKCGTSALKTMLDMQSSSSESEIAQIELRAGRVEIFLDCTPAQIFAIPGLIACMQTQNACC